ncbi:MAG: hypothetical protein MZV63_12150 [Marinilabiliales bacterium]|nr:hypothetical protein [Marinilabiliales bacterium]
MTVPRGIVLGHCSARNGAGKSTTMRMLTGQTRPTLRIDPGARLRRPHRLQAGPSPHGSRPTDRQPRHRADRRAEPDDVRSALPNPTA